MKTRIDLLSVTEKVASSLKEAEMVIKSSVATLSSVEISDDDKEEVLKQLGEILSVVKGIFIVIKYLIHDSLRN